VITTGRVVPADPIQKIMAVQLVEVAPEESLRSVAQELADGQVGAVLVRVPGNRSPARRSGSVENPASPATYHGAGQDAMPLS
jgi:hypothetical protein